MRLLGRRRDVLDGDFERNLSLVIDNDLAKPFLEAEADDIARRIERLTIEKLNRQDQIARLKEEVSRLGVEVADICTAIEAQEAAARVLADRSGRFQDAAA